jgi:ankyrin repeat protein
VNDRPRLGGTAASTACGASSSILGASLELLPAPIDAMSARYAAMVFNDLPAIRQLFALHVNPNTPQPDTGYTPLHIGVMKHHTKAVYLLLHHFHHSDDREKGAGSPSQASSTDNIWKSGSNSRNLRTAAGMDTLDSQIPRSYESMKTVRRRQRWLDINATDHNGNTPLHYASSLGYEDIVAMLCQEEDIQADKCNNLGEVPLDMAYGGCHQVFTLIRLAVDKKKLEEEIHLVKRR